MKLNETPLKIKQNFSQGNVAVILLSFEPKTSHLSQL